MQGPQDIYKNVNILEKIMKKFNLFIELFTFRSGIGLENLESS